MKTDDGEMCVRGRSQKETVAMAPCHLLPPPVTAEPHGAARGFGSSWRQKLSGLDFLSSAAADSQLSKLNAFTFVDLLFASPQKQSGQRQIPPAAGGTFSQNPSGLSLASTQTSSSAAEALLANNHKISPMSPSVIQNHRKHVVSAQTRRKSDETQTWNQFKLV